MENVPWHDEVMLLLLEFIKLKFHDVNYTLFMRTLMVDFSAQEFMLQRLFQ